MDGHYNLYYLFLEDKQSHPMPEALHQKILNALLGRLTEKTETANKTNQIKEKNNMKRTISTVLSLLLCLGLCACSSQPEKTRSTAPTVATVTTAPMETEPIETQPSETEPSEPTPEEADMLENYSSLLTRLRHYALTQNDYANIYTELSAIDPQVLKQWGMVVHPDWEESYWDWDSVMSRFTVIKDVLLEQKNFHTNHIGNTSQNGYWPKWEYDEQGRNSYITNEAASFRLYEQDPSNIGHPHSQVYEGDRLVEAKAGVNYMITYIYDDAGNPVCKKVTSADGKTYDIVQTFDEHNRLVETRSTHQKDKTHVYQYSYDTEGNMIHSEFTLYKYESYHSQDIIVEKDIMDYVYQNGVLVSGTRTYQDWTYSIDHKVVEEMYVDWQQVNTYTFTCDGQGRVTDIFVELGDSYYCSGKHKGEIRFESSYASENMQLIYGDYYIYTAPEENS